MTWTPRRGMAHLSASPHLSSLCFPLSILSHLSPPFRWPSGGTGKQAAGGCRSQGGLPCSCCSSSEAHPAPAAPSKGHWHRLGECGAQRSTSGKSSNGRRMLPLTSTLLLLEAMTVTFFFRCCYSPTSAAARHTPASVDLRWCCGAGWASSVEQQRSRVASPLAPAPTDRSSADPCSTRGRERGKQREKRWGHADKWAPLP